MASWSLACCCLISSLSHSQDGGSGGGASVSDGVHAGGRGEPGGEDDRDGEVRGHSQNWVGAYVHVSVRVGVNVRVSMRERVCVRTHVYVFLFSAPSELKITAGHWPFSVQFSTMATQNLTMIVSKF